MDRLAVRSRLSIAGVLMLLTLALGPARASGQGQERTVTGRVLDAEDHSPVSGAAVTSVQAAGRTQTTDRGTFSLRVPTGPITITADRTGYRSASIQVPEGQMIVALRMVRSHRQLETPIVTGAATTIPARNAPTAVDVISGDQADAAPGPTLENGMQGKITGGVVDQNNGGAPGGGLQVQLRGVTSINSQAFPLYVVDGVIVNNETVNSGLNALTYAGHVPLVQDPEDNTPNRIADVNPADIDRIEVLKGASAAAIYGSKGAAGAILITTKKGTDGAPRWQITAGAGTFEAANTLHLRTFPTYASADAWWHNDVGFATSLPPSLYTGNQNYQSQLFGGGEMSGQGNVSVRGGVGGTSYFASLLDKYDNGVMLNTGYSKQAARINLAQVISPALSATTNIYYQRSLSVRGVTGNDNNGISPYDVFATTPQFFNLNQQVTGRFVDNPFAFANPFADAALIQTPTTVDRFIAGGSVAWRAYTTTTQSLQVLVNGGADLARQMDLNYAPPALEVEQFSGFPGVVNSDRANTVYDNVSINLVHHFTGVRGIDATSSIGVSRDERDIVNPDEVGIGLSPGVRSPTQATVESTLEYRSRMQTQSIYVQEQLLTLSDRLAMTAGVTADRNSDDGVVTGYHFYPRYAASFRVPPPMGFVNELKLRAAYGQAGMAPSYGFNFNNAQNFYQTLIGQQRGLVVGVNQNSNIFYEVANAHLQPETTTELETGVNATLFRSRAQLSATIYQKRVSNLVMLGGASSSFGFNTTAFNSGQFTNQGIELSAEVTPVKSVAGVTWLSNVSFYRNYSRVDALPDGPFAIAPGFGGFYGSYWAQVGRSVSEIVNTRMPAADGTPVQVGDAQPSFVMSFGNTLSWRRFRLYGLVDWHRGGSVINLTNAYYDNGLFLLTDSAASVRRILAVNAGQTPYVESATFVKLRELTLDYQVPDEWLRITGGRVRSMRLSVSGRNLFASFRYSGLDPEVSDFGNTAVGRGQDVTPYPPARSLFLSVALGL